MSRPLVLRHSSLATLRFVSQPRVAQRRFASTLGSKARGRAAGTIVRWGLAGAVVYYYNTASVFADEPSYVQQPEGNAETYSTVETIAAQRRAQARASSTTDVPAVESVPLTDGSPQELEEEASQQGAFNEETGEINWDCPCLGGMADGPCGEQFKAAFSCFVFSKEEPKGIDCIEHFKTMQNCFREHPDVYGTELEPDEEDLPAEEPQTGVAHAVDVAREHVNQKVEHATDNLAADATAVAQEVSDVSAESTSSNAPTPSTANRTASTTQKQPSTVGDEGGDLVPKAWHNSTDDGRPQ